MIMKYLEVISHTMQNVEFFNTDILYKCTSNEVVHYSQIE
jgi:hypothetical protein